MLDELRIAVIGSIERAFIETSYPGDHRLLHPECGDDMEIADFVGMREWNRIPADVIERNNASLSFFSPEAFRFYLPAFLIWVLTYIDSSDSFTIDSTIYGLSPPRGGLGKFVLSKYRLLNNSQRRAVLGFLKYLEDNFRGKVDEQAVNDVIAYWQRAVECENKVMNDLRPSDALIEAASAGDRARFDSLLKIEVDKQNSMIEEERLHYAAWGGDVPTVTALIAAGTNLNAPSRWGYGPERFIDIPIWDVREDENGISFKCRGSSGITIRDKKGKVIYETLDWCQGSTPLHLAILKDHTSVARLLMEAGANVNAREVFGKTPLHYAVFGDASRTELIDVLLKSGADINARDDDGATPLASASVGQFGWATSFLKERGAEEDS